MSKKLDDTLDPSSRSGSPPPVRLRGIWLIPAIVVTDVHWSRKSTSRAGVNGSRVDDVLDDQRNTSRSGSGNASGRKMTLLITLKMAVLAPMPRARVATATAVNAGVFLKPRSA